MSSTYTPAIEVFGQEISNTLKGFYDYLLKGPLKPTEERGSKLEKSLTKTIDIAQKTGSLFYFLGEGTNILVRKASKTLTELLERKASIKAYRGLKEIAKQKGTSPEKELFEIATKAYEERFEKIKEQFYREKTERRGESETEKKEKFYRDSQTKKPFNTKNYFDADFVVVEEEQKEPPIQEFREHPKKDTKPSYNPIPPNFEKVPWEENPRDYRNFPFANTNEITPKEKTLKQELFSERMRKAISREDKQEILSYIRFFGEEGAKYTLKLETVEEPTTETNFQKLLREAREKRKQNQ